VNFSQFQGFFEATISEISDKFSSYAKIGSLIIEQLDIFRKATFDEAYSTRSPEPA